MKVLYIVAHPLTEENSNSRRLSKVFLDSYRESHPEDEIKEIDLYNYDIDFLQPQDIAVMYGDQNHRIKEVAEEFAQADKYIFASPMWNLNIPAILKAYIDYISYVGVTFKYTAEGAVGLLENKKAVYILSTGGIYSNAEDYNMGKKYMHTILGFLGITDVKTYMSEGTNSLPAEEVNARNKKLETQLIEEAKQF